MEKLFPLESNGNSLLACTYLSLLVLIIVGLVPSNVDIEKLTLLASMATGALLADICGHSIPEMFENVNDKEFLHLFVAILAGFFIFQLIANSLSHAHDDHGHSHGHSHSDNHADTDKIKVDDSNNDHSNAYVNIIGEFIHHLTDALALTSSFYISRQSGTSTFFASLLHELPHEVGEFALLLKQGLTKKQAIKGKFIAIIGSYVGTFIGIWFQSMEIKWLNPVATGGLLFIVWGVVKDQSLMGWAWTIVGMSVSMGLGL
ncbi:Zn(2+) transporter [Martiniozyma asiatica (nom. inval.)]|nr:Zn(2+) transporter [Martiniozyma asiatica]